MGDANAAVDILDIRNFQNGSDKHQVDLTNIIVEGLEAPFSAKSLPTILLYDERGLRLYDKITTDAPEYYLFGAEEEILYNHASDIVRIMQSRSLAGSAGIPSQVLLELGAGAIRKTSLILRALAGLLGTSMPPLTYFALDLEEREIQRALIQLHNSDVGTTIRGKIEAKGMLGTYDNESTGAARLSIAGQPQVHLLFLGSSIGNFYRGEDAQFLRSLPLRADSGDTLLLGLDHDNAREDIEIAYNDPKGRTRSFIMNGLRAAGNALGDSELFDLGNWEYVNFYDEGERVHKAFYKCLHPHSITLLGKRDGIHFLKDELIKIETSFKYSDRDAYTLFTDTNLRPIRRWTDSTSRYSLWLLERPPFSFPLLTSPTISTKEIVGETFGIPSIQDWQGMWKAWDFVTLRMIPSSMLFEKPIDLRHICLFYIGHIPAFLDIQLSRLLQEPHTEPEEFKFIFEAHSEVPKKDEDWPSLNSILSFRDRVRERLTKIYMNISSGALQLTRKIGRVLFMTYEHEALHIETLLYMLLQRAGSGTIPPPDFTPPPWESLLAFWNATPKPSSPTTVIEATTVTLGVDDIEAEDALRPLDLKGHIFGWDNESPSRRYTGVGKDKVQLPASWVENDIGEIEVRTFYGSVPMTTAWDWPVLTSYDNLSIYASVQGGRLPTEQELRVFMDKFECGYEGGANIGFRNWHPVPATTGLKNRGGQGHNGGVWEWTSTLLDKYPGFVPSQLYPGYSADFHDGCHHVVLGGSYVTIPRIAERRSVRNWYQHNYPYPWVGGRIVYDV
ncbi:histidine-specific methyltransferase [Chiua virens]|nr:histidine-specific methyltransferase [Chiua virens]